MTLTFPPVEPPLEPESTQYRSCITSARYAWSLLLVASTTEAHSRHHLAEHGPVPGMDRRRLPGLVTQLVERGYLREHRVGLRCTYTLTPDGEAFRARLSRWMHLEYCTVHDMLGTT